MMISLLLASIGAGICYRLGGIGKPWSTKYRDLLVPLFICLAMPFHWSIVICYVLSFGSMTTYWKKKGTDAQWWNWALTGFFYTLAYLPYFLCVSNIYHFLLSCILVTSLVTLWSQFIDIDWLEEFGRGFITALVIILFSQETL